jgi:hypothetical protein
MPSRYPPSLDLQNFIRAKRIDTLKGAWQRMDESRQDRFKLSDPIVMDVIEHYMDDWRIIKYRYGIDDEIQLHKIAGLMAAAIVRYRPVVYMPDQVQLKSDLCVNERLAVIHGLSICSEYSPGAVTHFQSNELFKDWVHDMVHHLRKRNYTAESLMLVFQTMSVVAFPEGFRVKS